MRRIVGVIDYSDRRKLFLVDFCFWFNLSGCDLSRRDVPPEPDTIITLESDKSRLFSG